MTIKKELNTGEDRRVKGAAIHGMRGFAKPGQDVDEVDPELLLNWGASGLVRMQVYVVDWSLKTTKGIKLKLPGDGAAGQAQYEALAKDLTMIIEDAITASVEQVDGANRPPAQVGSGTTIDVTPPSVGKPEPAQISA